MGMDSQRLRRAEVAQWISLCDHLLLDVLEGSGVPDSLTAGCRTATSISSRFPRWVP